jgi:hypothetical protein
MHTIIMGREERSDYFEHLDKKHYKKKYRRRVPFREIKGVQ